MNRDFGCGFLVFGCFRQLCQVLGIFLLFGFGLKVLQFRCHFKGLAPFLFDFGGVLGGLRCGFSSKLGFCGKYYRLKILACRGGLLHMLKNLKAPMIKMLEVTKEENRNTSGDGKELVNCDGEGYEQEEYCYNEDEVFDARTLRKLVKMERRRANDARSELEKERMASATAAEETMAMILRLQKEKSLVEMESHQYRRLAEEKQLHDQEVIQYLRWIVMKHELGRGLSEGRLRFRPQNLKQYMDSVADDQSQGVDESFSFLDALEDGLISSLDMGLSPQ